MTATNSADSAAADTINRRCSTCCEPIDPHAKKCKICDSYQDWRRFLNMSSSVLALLVALVSVLSFAVPIAAKMMAKNESNVTVALQTVYGNKAIFNASNSGNRPGAIGYSSLRITSQGETIWLPLPAVAEPPMIPPGESRQVTYELTAPIRQAIPAGPGEALFVIETIQFDGRQGFAKATMPLQRLRREIEFPDPRCRGWDKIDLSKLSQRESAFPQVECPRP